MAYVTTLSGDINGVADSLGALSFNDNTRNGYNNTGSNSYTVVLFRSGSRDTRVLDGFTISGGYHEINDEDAGGGGLRFESGSATIRNCIITRNVSFEGGGGVKLVPTLHEPASPTPINPLFVECTIKDNFAPRGGGLSCTTDASFDMVNCTVSVNVAGLGGGIELEGPMAPSIINTLIVGNITKVQVNTTAGGANSTKGGGLYAVSRNITLGATPSLTNCTIADNEAQSTSNGSGRGGGIFSDGGSRITLKNCIVRRNSGTYGLDFYSEHLLTNSVTHAASFSDIAPPTDLLPLGLCFGLIDQPNSINLDPKFIEGGYILQGAGGSGGISPCIDTASYSEAAADFADIDGDGITAMEKTPDLFRSDRSVDYPFAVNPPVLAPGQDGDCGIPDMGAYEVQDSAPKVTVVGSRYIKVIAPSSGANAIKVVGDATNPHVSCVSGYADAVGGVCRDDCYIDFYGDCRLLPSGYVSNCGQIVSTPTYRNACDWDEVYLNGDMIVPSGGVLSLTKYTVSAQAIGALDALGAPPVIMWQFGETNGEGIVDMDDLLCVLDCFGWTFTSACGFYGCDVSPMWGNIDVDDLVAVMAGYSGAVWDSGWPCGGTAPSTFGVDSLDFGPTGPVVATFGISSSTSYLMRSALTNVDVFVQADTGLIGAQIGVDASSPSAGAELVDAFVDETRSDFVFAGHDVHIGVDLHKGRLLAVRKDAIAVIAGGASVAPPSGSVYVGTFVFRVSSRSAGSMKFAIRQEDTHLRDTSALPVRFGMKQSGVER